MKKIWIDGYEANVAQRLGSGQVAFELIKNIEILDKDNDYTVLLPSAPLPDLPKVRDKFRYKILKPKKLWTRIALPLALFTSKEKPDVIFSPTHYIPRFSPVKKVVTIFDLAYLHFPQMFTKRDLLQLTRWTKYSILNANAIITISNSSKLDIIKNYKVSKEKITVAYPGVDTEIFHQNLSIDKINEVKDKFGVGKNYIIYTGTIQPRKNLKRLMEAFGRVINSSESDLKLVIIGKAGGVGRKGWMYEDILKKPKELGIEKNVLFLGYVEKDDLIYLLNGALASISVSLYEGFGLTILEALACGVPAIVSNVSSLPEVVGKAGLLVNPKSVDQIEQAIRVMVTDKKLRAGLKKLSLEQAKKFSWKKMAKEVIKVLELL